MRKNIITIALSLAMLAAAPLGCGPLPAPDGGSTGALETSTDPGEGGEGDTLACEGDPCVDHEDCKAGLDLLMCWPVGRGEGVCMEACDPMDAHACGDAPERCSAVPGTPVFLCQPVIHKAPNNSGKCVPK